MTSLERLNHRVRLLEMERKGKFHIIFFDVETESKEEAIERYKQENKVNPKDNFIIIRILPEDIKLSRDLLSKERMK